MTNYERGRRAEYRTMRRLEEEGYHTARMAGSHGPFDVHAYDAQGFVLVQVKYGNRWPGPEEMESIELEPVPPNAKKQVWLWRKGARAPEVRTV